MTKEVDDGSRDGAGRGRPACRAATRVCRERCRGGVVVSHAVAETLHLPFDILVIHKNVEPGRSWRQLGVVAEPDHLVVHENRVRELGLPPGWLEETTVHGLGDPGHGRQTVSIHTAAPEVKCAPEEG
jgi:hypothetical protein